MGYAARTKYDEPGRACRYAARSPAREVEEWRLLEALLGRLPKPPRTALDVPCGTGRIAARLLDRGVPTVGADLSPAMRAEAARRLAGRPGFGGVVSLDLEAARPDPSLAADLVVCFRFLHHLPDAATRLRVLRSLAALTRQDLLLSFHHPVSGHAAARLLRRMLGRGPGDRYTLLPSCLRREAAAAGLDWVTAVPLGRYRRELWVAWLRPVEHGGSVGAG